MSIAAVLEEKPSAAPIDRFWLQLVQNNTCQTEREINLLLAIANGQKQRNSNYAYLLVFDCKQTHKNVQPNYDGVLIYFVWTGPKQQPHSH